MVRSIPRQRYPRRNEVVDVRQAQRKSGSRRQQPQSANHPAAGSGHHIRQCRPIHRQQHLRIILRCRPHHRHAFARQGQQRQDTVWTKPLKCTSAMILFDLEVSHNAQLAVIADARSNARCTPHPGIPAVGADHQLRLYPCSIGQRELCTIRFDLQ